MNICENCGAEDSLFWSEELECTVCDDCGESF